MSLDIPWPFIPPELLFSRGLYLRVTPIPNLTDFYTLTDQMTAHCGVSNDVLILVHCFRGLLTIFPLKLLKRKTDSELRDSVTTQALF